MSGRYLLDTSVAIDILNGVEILRQPFLRSDEIFLSTVALGELYIGALRSARPVENAAQINSLVDDWVILDADRNSARWYAQVKRVLLDKGRPIPENDIWIAAIARQHNLILATRDQHFQQVDGLIVEYW